MLSIKKIPFNSFQESCAIVWNNAGECAIIDPGFYNEAERDELYGFIESKKLTPSKILLTHGHADHIFGVKECAEHYNIPVYMHPADRLILDKSSDFCRIFGLKQPELFETEDIQDGQTITLGEDNFEVLHTPGHTPGGVCYLSRENKLMFTGDTLFAGTIGRTDNSYASYDELMASIFTKLMDLDGDIDIHPGHGPESSIAEERTTNPFLQPFNEPYED